MSGRNPIAYAEGVLGVHAVHDEAKAALAELSAAKSHLRKTAHAVRAKQEELASHEAELTITARAENAEMSETAFQRHLRLLLLSDADCSRLRTEISELQAAQEAAKADLALAGRFIDIAVARMNELQGLLVFYAARVPQPDNT